MSGRHPNALRKADTRGHGVVQDALDRGFLASQETYRVPGMPDHATANEARLSVGRALAHFNLPKAAWVVDESGKPCYRACKSPDAPHGVAFRVYSKNAARAYVVAKTGGDARKLKYNPFERRSVAALDDAGNQRQQ